MRSSRVPALEARQAGEASPRTPARRVPAAPEPALRRRRGSRARSCRPSADRRRHPPRRATRRSAPDNRRSHGRRRRGRRRDVPAGQRRERQCSAPKRQPSSSSGSPTTRQRSEACGINSKTSKTAPSRSSERDGVRPAALAGAASAEPSSASSPASSSTLRAGSEGFETTNEPSMPQQLLVELEQNSDADRADEGDLRHVEPDSIGTVADRLVQRLAEVIRPVGVESAAGAHLERIACFHVS